MSTATPSKNLLNLTILGSGALANLFGARLAPYAHVILLGSWAAGLQAIGGQGIVIETNNGPQLVTGIRATSNPGDVPAAQVVLVLVKSWQTVRAAAHAQQVLAPDGIVVTLQNGLGNREVLAGALGVERVTLGVTTQGAALLDPGHIRYAGGGDTTLGRLPASATPAAANRLQVLAELLNTAGLPTHLTDNIEVLLWGKLVVNAGINPITALLRVPNGSLLEHPLVESLMVAAAEECAAVAQAQGIELPFEAAERVREVARLTAINRSSMLQDVLRGAPTEIEAINGAVVAAGEAAGVPVSVNAMLVRLIRGVVALSDRRIDS